MPSRRLVASLLSGAVLLAGCSGGAGRILHHEAAAVSFAVTPTVTKAGTSSTDPVVVHAQHGTLDSVRLTDPKGTELPGDFSPDRTTWTARTALGYDTKYTLDAAAHNSEKKQATQRTSFTTVKPAGLATATLFPGEEGSDVGIGQPISVSFDQPVTDRAAAQRSLQVRTTPDTEGSWNWVNDQEVRWRPKDFWKPGTKVSVEANVYGKNLGKNIYGGKDQKVDFTIHDSWVAVGNVSTHDLTIYHNDKVVNTFPASFGRPAYPTHDGIHVVQEKYELLMMNSASWGLPADSPDGYSNFPAYWSTRISNGGEFVHANDGTTYAQGVDNVSHGCINLTTERAKWFYEHFDHGDVVKIVGGDPMLPQDDGYGDWNISWQKYLQGSALR